MPGRAKDQRNSVENLSLGSGRWLSDKNDRSGRIEAIFQLEKPSVITHVDVGAHFCFTVEIKVGKSSWAQTRDFVTLVPCSAFMRPFDCKVGNRKDVVRMFKQDEFHAESRDEKWDRVKVICLQPFKKDTQFGLSMFKLKNMNCPEEAVSPRTAKNRENKATSPQKSTEDIQRHFFGAVINENENCAVRKESLNKLGALNENTSGEDLEYGSASKLVLATTSKFMDEAVTFLNSLNFKELDLDALEVSDLRHRLEKRKARKLSKEEKKIFIELAMNHVNSFLEKEPGDLKGKESKAASPDLKSPSHTSPAAKVPSMRLAHFCRKSDNVYGKTLSKSSSPSANSVMTSVSESMKKSLPNLLRENGYNNLDSDKYAAKFKPGIGKLEKKDDIDSLVSSNKTETEGNSDDTPNVLGKKTQKLLPSDFERMEQKRKEALEKRNRKVNATSDKPIDTLPQRNSTSTQNNRQFSTAHKAHSNTVKDTCNISKTPRNPRFKLDFTLQNSQNLNLQLSPTQTSTPLQKTSTSRTRQVEREMDSQDIHLYLSETQLSCLDVSDKSISMNHSKTKARSFLQHVVGKQSNQSNSSCLGDTQMLNLRLSVSSESDQSFTQLVSPRLKGTERTKDSAWVSQHNIIKKPHSTTKQTLDPDLSQELDSLLMKAKMKKSKRGKKRRKSCLDISSSSIKDKFDSDVEDLLITDVSGGAGSSSTVRSRKRRKQEPSPVPKRRESSDHSVIITQYSSPEIFSTPPEIELVSCPLCSKEMPMRIIEGHAATCNGPVSEQTIDGTHGRAPCPFCGIVYPVQVLPQHADFCSSKLTW